MLPQVGKFDEPGAVGKPGRQLGSQVDREPGLPDAAGPAQRERAARADAMLAKLAQLAFAADKGIKLLAGIAVNTEFHVAARLSARGISRSYLRDQ